MLMEALNDIQNSHPDIFKKTEKDEDEGEEQDTINSELIKYKIYHLVTNSEEWKNLKSTYPRVEKLLILYFMAPRFDKGPLSDTALIKAPLSVHPTTEFISMFIERIEKFDFKRDFISVKNLQSSEKERKEFLTRVETYCKNFIKNHTSRS